MKKSPLRTIGFTAASSVLASSIAMAQSPSLEEVVVTAKKRVQNLQDVAGSVQVISEDDLARNQMTGFDDYSRMVPSLTALSSGAGQTQISMRGVFSARLNHAQPQSRSTIGLYLEDIPITTSAFNPDAGLVDIERIEVLRGPQGTLYGASAMSGAIRVIPVAPSLEEVEGQFSATVSSTEDGEESYRLMGTLNLPISDTFGIRGNVYAIDNGGYIDNVFTGEDDYNDEETVGGRISALWEVSDTFSLKGMVLYNKLEADGRPDEYEEGNPLNNTGLNSGASLIASPFESTEQWTISDERQTIKLVDDPFDDEYYIIGLTADLDFDWGRMTSVTSYFDREFFNELDDNQRERDALGAYSAGCYTSGFNFDDPSCEPVIAFFSNDSEADQFTQELRFSAVSDSDVQWVLGVFYSDQSRNFDQEVPYNTLSGEPALEDLANVFGFGGIDFGGDPNNVFQGAQSIDTQQIAVFGEATIPMGDRWEVTLGLRWYEYEQDADIIFAGLANDGLTELDTDTSEDGVNPNVVFKYNFSDDVNAYASAAKGFRIGGLNDPIPLSGVFGSACASDLDSLGLTSLEESYDSDELWNYEVGVKSTLSDGRIRMNAALFYIDWEDIQTQAFLPCGFQTITNDASLESQGLEFEMLAQATESLSLNINFSYTDATLNGDSVILAAEDGDQAPYTPEWLAFAGFDYTVPVDLMSDAEVYLRGDIQYTSESYSEFSENFVNPRRELPSHTSGNLYLGLVNPSWEAALFVKNVTDERIVTGFDPDRRQPATFSILRPRTIGLDFKYRF